MTSLGTCRLVMPLSESTMARSGPAARAAAMSASIVLALVARAARSRRASRSPRPLLGSTPRRSKRGAVLGEDVGEEGPHGVAEDDRVGDLHHRGLEVDREQHALSAWRRRSARRGRRRGREALMTVASTISPAVHGQRRPCSTVTVPSAPTCSMRSVSAAARVTDCSLLRKSPAAMWATCVLESGDQAPIEWGWERAYSLTDGGRPAVGVALAEHRVDRRALDLVVPGPDVGLLGGRRLLGVVGHGVARGPGAPRWPR